MRTDGRLTSILAKESNSIILWLICIGNFLCELIGLVACLKFTILEEALQIQIPLMTNELNIINIWLISFIIHIIR